MKKYIGRKIYEICFVTIFAIIMTFVMIIRQKQASIICNPIDINTKPYCDMVNKEMKVELKNGVLVYR